MLRSISRRFAGGCGSEARTTLRAASRALCLITAAGTLTVVRQLLEQGTTAHVRSAGPRFFHWVIGGSTPAALAADWFAILIDQNAGAWDMSPLAVQLEEVSLAWLQDSSRCPPTGREC